MRRAFTILELLAVIVVLAFLVALMLPAVQYARESSRRATCAANVSELGRALHNYQSAFGGFPPAMPHTPENPTIGNAWYAPHAQLLPYVEQNASFGSVNLAVPVMPAISRYAPPVSVDGSVGEARGAVPPVFKCPSDRADGGAAPATNYRVCMGVKPQGWTHGPFVILRSRPPGDFLDGLSSTMGMSEKLLGAAMPAKFSYRRDFWYTGASALQWAPSADEMVQLCGAGGASPSGFYSFAGYSWFYAGYEFTWYNHVATPNSATPDCAVDAGQPPDGVRHSPVAGGLFQATSNHSGGVNCLMMDGACRFVSNEVDVSVWRAFATVAGGEALGGGS